MLKAVFPQGDQGLLLASKVAPSVLSKTTFNPSQRLLTQGIALFDNDGWKPIHNNRIFRQALLSPPKNILLKLLKYFQPFSIAGLLIVIHKRECRNRTKIFTSKNCRTEM